VAHTRKTLKASGAAERKIGDRFASPAWLPSEWAIWRVALFTADAVEGRCGCRQSQLPAVTSSSTTGTTRVVDAARQINAEGEYRAFGRRTPFARLAAGRSSGDGDARRRRVQRPSRMAVVPPGVAEIDEADEEIP